MMRIIHAEWTKLRTLSSSAWLVLAAVAFTVLLGLMVTAAMDIKHCAEPCLEDTAKLSLTGVRLGQVAIVVLAVLIVSNEYATRMVLTTLTAAPRRIRRERDPRRRRDRYVIDADVWFRGWVASAQQNVALAGGARQGAEVLGVDTPAGARMQDIGEFFEYIGKAMIEAAERWRQTQN